MNVAESLSRSTTSAHVAVLKCFHQSGNSGFGVAAHEGQRTQPKGCIVANLSVGVVQRFYQHRVNQFRFTRHPTQGIEGKRTHIGIGTGRALYQGRNRLLGGRANLNQCVCRCAASGGSTVLFVDFDKGGHRVAGHPLQCAEPLLRSHVTNLGGSVMQSERRQG